MTFSGGGAKVDKKNSKYGMDLNINGYFDSQANGTMYKTTLLHKKQCRMLLTALH